MIEISGQIKRVKLAIESRHSVGLSHIDLGNALLFEQHKLEMTLKKISKILYTNIN
jgi:hypothetical protein